MRILGALLAVILVVIILILFFRTFVIGGGARGSSVSTTTNIFTTQQNMQINSQSFPKGGSIPSRYTCDGENVHPALTWWNAPKEAKSFAFIMDDPDSPSGTWTHWLLWNIGASETVIFEGALPTGGVEGKTSFGAVGYGGPCPNAGTHRYFFKIYALNSLLNLKAGATRIELENAMRGHILKEASVFGTYQRNQQPQ